MCFLLKIVHETGVLSTEDGALDWYWCYLLKMAHETGVLSTEDGALDWGAIY